MISCAAAHNGITVSLPDLYRAPGMVQTVPPSDSSAAPHPSRLASPRGREQHEPHEGAERPLVLLGRHPQASQFLVGQDPRARPLRDRGAAAAPDQRRDEIGTGGMPAQQGPQRGETAIARTGPLLSAM